MTESVKVGAVPTGMELTVVSVEVTDHVIKMGKPSPDGPLRRDN